MISEQPSVLFWRKLACCLRSPTLSWLHLLQRDISIISSFSEIILVLRPPDMQLHTNSTSVCTDGDQGVILEAFHTLFFTWANSTQLLMSVLISPCDSLTIQDSPQAPHLYNALPYTCQHVHSVNQTLVLLRCHFPRIAQRESERYKKAKNVGVSTFFAEGDRTQTESIHVKFVLMALSRRKQQFLQLFMLMP